MGITGRDAASSVCSIEKQSHTTPKTISGVKYGCKTCFFRNISLSVDWHSLAGKKPVKNTEIRGTEGARSLALRIVEVVDSPRRICPAHRLCQWLSVETVYYEATFELAVRWCRARIAAPRKPAAGRADRTSTFEESQ